MLYNRIYKQALTKWLLSLKEVHVYGYRFSRTGRDPHNQSLIPKRTHNRQIFLKLRETWIDILAFVPSIGAYKARQWAGEGSLRYCTQNDFSGAHMYSILENNWSTKLRLLIGGRGYCEGKHKKFYPL